MSNEKDECFFSCSSLNDLKAKNKAEVIDINDNSSKIQLNYYQKEDIETQAHVPINTIIAQDQAQDTNDPSISLIDMTLFNKNQSTVSSGNDNEKELFYIEENYAVHPKVAPANNNANNIVQIVSLPSIQSFQGNESIKIPTQLFEEDYVITKINDNMVKSNSSQVDQTEEKASPNASYQLIIDELPEKKDYNGTSYKPYQILKYNKQSKDYETKCERRFDNFDAFYSKITRKFPYVILPQLSQKNVLSKIISNDTFFQRRKKQLTFLLNYIYSNASLLLLPEIAQFIDSIEFNEEYYKSTTDDFICDLHIKHNTMNKLKSSVYSYFKQSDDSDEKYSQINKIYAFYSKISKAVEKIKVEIGIMSKFSIKAAKNYSNLGSDLSFIREVKTINKEEIKLYEDISMQMSQTSKGPFFDALYDKVDNFALLMQGLVEMLERYNKFIKRFKLIRETYQDYVKNTSNYSPCDIRAIKDKAEEKKGIFEKELFASIDLFVEQYGTLFPELIHEYKELIFKVNEMELGQLKTVSQY